MILRWNTGEIQDGSGVELVALWPQEFQLPFLNEPNQAESEQRKSPPDVGAISDQSGFKHGTRGFDPTATTGPLPKSCPERFGFSVEVSLVHEWSYRQIARDNFGNKGVRLRNILRISRQN